MTSISKEADKVIIIMPTEYEPGAVITVVPKEYTAEIRYPEVCYKTKYDILLAQYKMLLNKDQANGK